MMEQSRRKYGRILLGLLLWILFFTILCVLLPDYLLLRFLQPFTVFRTFLHLWIDPAWSVMLLLAVVPLFGYLLLLKGTDAGRWLIYIPQWLILASACIITPLHIFNEFGYINATGARAGNAIGLTVLYGLPAVVYPILVLIFTSKWKPNIKS